MPSRKLILAAGCIAAATLTACTTGPTSPTRLSSSGSEPSPAVHISHHPFSQAYLGGPGHSYRGTQTFCLRPPLSGTATYSVHAGRAGFTLDIHGFPPRTGVGLDWINNRVRGYMVGAFTTDAAGSYLGHPRMFRPGEVRAIAIKFERADGTGLQGIGKPC